MTKFFISYSRSVKQEVGNVVDLLRAAGHEVWWDGDIPIIADWWATTVGPRLCRVGPAALDHRRFWDASYERLDDYLHHLQDKENDDDDNR